MKGNGYLVREFAKLTRVTVRALHYYDQIGLAQAQLRAAERLRVYTDADLLKLQQIVTLKFMGFSLDEIRRLLDSKGYEAVKALKVQAEAVKDEIVRTARGLAGNRTGPRPAREGRPHPQTETHQDHGGHSNGRRRQERLA